MPDTEKRLEAPPHEIIIVQSKEELQQCFNVRIEVFHHEQGFPLEIELDDKEEISTHFLLRLKPSLKSIGTIRGYPVPGTIMNTYKLSRLAVLKDYRQYGFGGELVEALHQWVQTHAIITAAAAAAAAAAESGANNVDTRSGPNQAPDGQADAPGTGIKWLQVISHSQLYVKGFYARFGYMVEGDEFIEDGDPHQKMVLRIPITARTVRRVGRAS